MTGVVDADVLSALEQGAGDADDPQLLVLIEHGPARGQGPPASEAEDPAGLVARSRVQHDLIEYLATLGVRHARPLALADAVEARLTRGQVLAVAQRPEVSRIQRAGPARVTT